MVAQFVRAGFRHEVIGAQQGFERAGIGPPAIQNFIRQLPSSI